MYIQWWHIVVAVFIAMIIMQIRYSAVKDELNKRDERLKSQLDAMYERLNERIVNKADPSQIDALHKRLSRLDGEN